MAKEERERRKVSGGRISLINRHILQHMMIEPIINIF